MADNKPNREQDRNPSQSNVDPNRDKSMSGQGGSQTGQGQNRQSGFGQQGSQTGRTDKPIGDPKSDENIRRGEGTANANRDDLENEDDEENTGLGKSSGY